MTSLLPTTPADDTEGEEDQVSPKEDGSQSTNPNIIDNLDNLPNHAPIDNNNNNHSHLLLEGSDPPPPFEVGKKKRRSAKKVLFNKRKNDMNNNNNSNNNHNNNTHNNIHEHPTLNHLDYNS